MPRIVWLRRCLLLLALVPLPGLLDSCNDCTGPECGDPPPPPPAIYYSELTSPENLVANLQVAYRRREIGKYAELLSSDFRFLFGPMDQGESGTVESWTAEQDSTGTDALFRTPLVSSIRIELLPGDSGEPTELGHPPDAVRIQLSHVRLEVDQVDGTTFLVTQPQDLYFRPGREALGEDPARWYLLEWRELPLPAAPKPGGVRNTTWAVLKSRYIS